MTLIGAFNCQNSVVIFADRQETISDYAKWDQGKIYLMEAQGDYRILMAGAGDPAPIDEIWERIVDPSVRTTALPDYEKLPDFIIRTVRTVTKKTIFPVPADQRPMIELIWAIQPLGQNKLASQGVIKLFRTFKLSTNIIKAHYLTGNPILLVKFLSDMYLDGLILTVNEAEALAAYMLWEAKEYDPTCGKYSDIYTLRWSDDSISRMTLPELKYWDEHFEYVKKSMKLVPLLSCSGGLIKQIYKPEDHLRRLVATIKMLAKEQEKMRRNTKRERSKLATKLHRNLTKVASRYTAIPIITQSASRKSKPAK